MKVWPNMQFNELDQCRLEEGQELVGTVSNSLLPCLSCSRPGVTEMPEHVWLSYVCVGF